MLAIIMLNNKQTIKSSMKTINVFQCFQCFLNKVTLFARYLVCVFHKNPFVQYNISQQEIVNKRQDVFFPLCSFSRGVNELAIFPSFHLPQFYATHCLSHALQPLDSIDETYKPVNRSIFTIHSFSFLIKFYLVLMHATYCLECINIFSKCSFKNDA
jgi:hypothetical protein